MFSSLLFVIMLVICLVIHSKKLKIKIIESSYSINLLIYIKLLYSLLAIVLGVIFYYKFGLAHSALLIPDIKTYAMYAGICFLSAIFTFILLFVTD